MKLLQSHKDTIKNKIVSQKFNPLFEAHSKKIHAFVNRVLDTVPRIAELNDMPDGWFPEVSTIYFSFDGWSKRLPLGCERRIPNCVSERGFRFLKDAPEWLEENTLHHELELLKEQKKELESEISKVLCGVTTDKRLSEVWPEAVKYLPTVPPPVPAVVSIDRLKQLLA